MDNPKIKKKSLKNQIQIGEVLRSWKINELPQFKNRYIKCSCIHCPIIKEIDYISLLRGTAGKCICQDNRRKVKIGEVVGFWQVLEIENYRKIKCLCLGCQKEIRILSNRSILDGHRRSCGCLEEDLRKQTCQERYGANFYSSSEARKLNEEKMNQTRKKTNVERYGKENFTQTDLWKQKSIETCQKKYGTDRYIDTDECKEKIKKTNLDKYGVEHYSQTEEYKDKYTKTCMENFGTKSPLQNEDIKQKTKETNVKKYGYENVSQNSEIKEKVKKTLERLRLDEKFNEKIKQKTKQTNLERYGKENYSQTDECKQRIINTCQKKYGVDSINQVAEIALKQARSLKNSYLERHWKTEEELVCTGTWEQKVVRYLNKNQVEYSWQPEVFKLSTGRTYRPDLYLIDQDLWIEIKGFFLGMAEEKWNEFHSIIKPNSELWNLQKLKEMKIL